MNCGVIFCDLIVFGIPVIHPNTADNKLAQAGRRKYCNYCSIYFVFQQGKYNIHDRNSTRFHKLKPHTLFRLYPNELPRIQFPCRFELRQMSKQIGIGCAVSQATHIVAPGDPKVSIFAPPV